MKKLMYLTAATLLVAGLAAAPAFAQGTAKTTTTKTTKTATMKKSHHAMSCYDYAWDSQAQKDCLAGKKFDGEEGHEQEVDEEGPRRRRADAASLRDLCYTKAPCRRPTDRREGVSHDPSDRLARPVDGASSVTAPRCAGRPTPRTFCRRP